MAEALLLAYYAAAHVVKRDTGEELRADLAREQGGAAGFWIAYAGEVAAGCVALRPLDLVAGTAECKRLYVREEFRGQGVANALLASLEVAAFADGTEWIYLDSAPGMEAAVRLYLRRGYRPCARYNDNPQATVFLRKARPQES